MDSEFILDTDAFAELATRLVATRKLQKLSRSQAASVCNVSASFIRDAETEPGRCSLAKLMQVINGLGLRMSITGWQAEP